MVDKAPDAFRTISEVAEDLDLPQHVLRFWETRFQQIKPMKRGGGRRYYRPDDVDLLRGIRHLLYGEGYTIRGVQRMLKDHGVKFVQSVWKADAPRPLHDEEEPEPLARPLPGSSRRGEEGAHRRLFGLLPSFLASDREAEDEHRIEPPAVASASAARPSKAEPDEHPAPMHVAATPARALSGDHVAKLQAMVQELQECRRLLDAAMTQA